MTRSSGCTRNAPWISEGFIDRTQAGVAGFPSRLSWPPTAPAFHYFASRTFPVDVDRRLYQLLPQLASDLLDSIIAPRTVSQAYSARSNPPGPTPPSPVFAILINLWASMLHFK